MTGLCITEAGSQDIDDLCSLLGELFSIEQDFDINIDKQLRGLRLLLEAENAIVLTARFDNRIIGMATMQTVVSTAEGGLSGWVEDVVVTASFRGKGVGGELLNALEKAARRKGCLRIQLLADKDNRPALDFYGAHHWRETSLVAWRKAGL